MWKSILSLSVPTQNQYIPSAALRVCVVYGYACLYAVLWIISSNKMVEWMLCVPFVRSDGTVEPGERKTALIRTQISCNLNAKVIEICVEADWWVCLFVCLVEWCLSKRIYIATKSLEIPAELDVCVCVCVFAFVWLTKLDNLCLLPFCRRRRRRQLNWQKTSNTLENQIELNWICRQMECLSSSGNYVCASRRGCVCLCVLAFVTKKSTETESEKFSIQET